MEYIQTILFQVTTEGLERASESGGLIPELDEHRDFLKQQSGFRDIRITRSINPEGNVLVVVETRWDDDASLVRYETNEPNIASIVRRHENVIVPDSLQVLDMEAIRTETSFERAEAAESAAERVTLPIAIPVAALAFIVLIVYGLSRVYLELGGDAAVGLAAAIAFGVLIGAFYFANNPKAPPWQIGGALTVAALVLLGGSIWAVVEEDEAEGGEPPTNGEPNGEPNGETPPPGDGGDGEEMVIILDDFFIEYQGEQDPNITIAAGEEITFGVSNVGAAIHNVQVNGTDDTYAESICTIGGDNNGCSDPNTMPGGTDGTMTIQIDEPGVYNFRCDFHPVQMIGTFTVE